MATTGPGTTALVPGPQLHQLQAQRLLFFFLIAIVFITTPSTFIVYRLHLTFDPIAVQDQINRIAAVHYSKLFLRTQACSAVCYHGLVFVDKWVLRRSAASVGAVYTLFKRDRPHFDLYRISSSRSSLSSHFRSHRSPRPAVNRTAAAHYP